MQDKSDGQTFSLERQALRPAEAAPATTTSLLFFSSVGLVGIHSEGKLSGTGYSVSNIGPAFTVSGRLKTSH